MLGELVDFSNYVGFNSTVARLTDLQTAVYISELLRAYNIALHTKQLDNMYFNVPREEITYRTTLTASDQKAIDISLQQLNVVTISKTDANRVSVDVSRFISWIGGDEAKKINTDGVVIKKKRTKSEIIADKLKATVDWDDIDIKQATYNWIDAVYAKDGWMTKEAVATAKNVVMSFAYDQRGFVDKQRALALINEASINGYRDMQWAVNSYMRKYPMGNVTRLTPEQEEISRIGF